MLRKALLSLLLLACTTLSGMAFTARDVHAAYDDPPAEFVEVPVHVVQPGDTLFSIARRYGTDVKTLTRVNGLSDPRQIYAGQSLHLLPASSPTPLDLASWGKHTLRMGEEVLLLARQTGLGWKDFADANGILNPGALLMGHEVRVPSHVRARRVSSTPESANRLSLALREERPYWEVARFNPQPLHGQALLVLPGEVSLPGMPHPLASMVLTPQPVVRGGTAVFAIETVEPATCEVAYNGRVEPCYAQDATHLYALVSFSPMADPKTYPIDLTVRAGGAEMHYEFPLVVTAGRFGYERIDVPAGRRSLSTPELLQAEREKLDAIAYIRSPQRFWDLPLAYPVHASISSYFGSRRSYGGSYNSYHSGVDFRAGTGTPVRVPATGVVVLAEHLPVRGNAIMIDHGWGLVTGYWHLSKIDVQQGQWVQEGQMIGRVGNTGLSTGSHLHWEVWVDGTPVNPLQWVDEFFVFPEPAAHVVDGVE